MNDTIISGTKVTWSETGSDVPKISVVIAAAIPHDIARTGPIPTKRAARKQGSLISLGFFTFSGLGFRCFKAEFRFAVACW